MATRVLSYTVYWPITGKTLYYTVNKSDNTTVITRTAGYVESTNEPGKYTVDITIDLSWDRFLTIVTDDGILDYSEEIEITDYAPAPVSVVTATSPYLLFGLPHYVFLKKSSGEIDDGAAGIIKAGYTILVPNLNCRITTYNGEDSRMPSGYDGENRFYVIAQYCDLVNKDEYITVSPNTSASIVATPGDYLIIWYKHQIDENGYPHHTSFIMEKQ